MDYTTILIGLAIIAGLFIIGKVFAILTKILFIIILVAIISIGAFFWINNQKENPIKPSFLQENVHKQLTFNHFI